MPAPGRASEYKWARYLPVAGDYKEPDLEYYCHVEPSSRARLTGVTGISPEIGTEIHRLQLSALSPGELDEFSLLLGRRALLVFHRQDFADLSFGRQKEIVSHFGRLHVHPISDHVTGPREHLVFYRTKDNDVFRAGTAPGRVSTTLWHHDQSFEHHPPSATFLTGFTLPERCGRDIEYVNMVSAYNRLSPSFRGYLETLSALRSGVEQAEESTKRGNGILRREPVETIHPVIRVHPGTGEKALFVNAAFTKHIIGLKKEESDTTLNFIYDFIAKPTEFHARVRWEDGTVIV